MRRPASAVVSIVASGASGSYGARITAFWARGVSGVGTEYSSDRELILMCAVTCVILAFAKTPAPFQAVSHALNLISLIFWCVGSHFSTR